MKSKKNIVGIGIIVVFLLTLFFQYTYSYDLYKKPPSNLWSKEVKVGNGNTKTNPIVIKEDKRILVAYDDIKRLSISSTDSKGQPISSKNFSVDEEFIKDTLFVKTNNGYILGYNSTINSVGYLEKLFLDEELNLVKRERIEGVNFIYQLDSNNYVLAYKDKIEIIDSIRDKNQDVKVSDVSMITGSKVNNGFFICFIEGKDTFKFFTTEGDIVNEPKIAAKLNKSDNVGYGQISCSSDGKKGYIILEEQFKGEFNGAKGIEFSLDGSDSVVNPVYIGNSKIIRENTGVYSQDGGKFYGVFGRAFGKKSYQENIISFTLKDGKTSDIEYVSRTRETCFSPYVVDDYTAYLSFSGIDSKDINIGSTNEEFKQVNNAPRASERSRALGSAMEGLMYGLAYVFVYGFKWILPVMLVAGTFAFFDYAYSEKTKLRGFIGLAIFAIAVKTYGIIPVFYVDYAGLLPEVLSSKLVGVLVCSLIGAISYAYGYLLYKRDTEDLGILKFFISLFVDTVLTLVIFVPFIT
ncbi:hypothetical protein [Clostridium sp.]|uniref:hypothetical protein n=1 Tax=Clostridium sp. TaxID=1506 RepID=UPI002FCA2F90